MLVEPKEVIKGDSKGFSVYNVRYNFLPMYTSRTIGFFRQKSEKCTRRFLGCKLKTKFVKKGGEVYIEQSSGKMSRRGFRNLNI